LKQNITSQQWKELDKQQQAKFNHYPVSIGDLIEFLGDDLFKWENFGVTSQLDTKHGKWCLLTELCDALWEACKVKITRPHQKGLISRN